jgi:hypothetical protein
MSMHILNNSFVPFVSSTAISIFFISASRLLKVFQTCLICHNRLLRELHHSRQLPERVRNRLLRELHHSRQLPERVRNHLLRELNRIRQLPERVRNHLLRELNRIRRLPERVRNRLLPVALLFA